MTPCNIKSHNKGIHSTDGLPKKQATVLDSLPPFEPVHVGSFQLLRQGPIGNNETCLTLVQRAVPEEACCSRRLLPCNAMWPCYCLGGACRLGAPRKHPAFAMHLSFASISDTELWNTETILFASCMAYLLFTFVSHDAFHVSFMRMYLQSTSHALGVSRMLPLSSNHCNDQVALWPGARSLHQSPWEMAKLPSHLAGAKLPCQTFTTLFFNFYSKPTGNIMSLFYDIPWIERERQNNMKNIFRLNNDNKCTHVYMYWCSNSCIIPHAHAIRM